MHDTHQKYQWRLSPTGMKQAKTQAIAPAIAAPRAATAHPSL
jgi:hypothetical protein